MQSSPVKYFVLIYSKRDAQSDYSVLFETFTSSDDAIRSYNKREFELSHDPLAEVLLVGADSIETVRKTHESFWFRGTAQEAVENLLATI